MGDVMFRFSLKKRSNIRLKLQTSRRSVSEIFERIMEKQITDYLIGEKNVGENFHQGKV